MSPLGSPASYFSESGVEVFLAVALAAVFVPALLVEAAVAVFFLADEAVVVFLVEADLVVFVAVFVVEDFAVEALAADVLVVDFDVVFLAVEAFEAVVFAVAAERLGAGFLVGAALGSVIGASV